MTSSLYAVAVAALCILPAWTALVLRAHISMRRNLRTAIRRSDDVLRLYDVASISTETRASGLLVRPTARIRVDLRRTRRPVVLDIGAGEDAALIAARILAAVEDRMVGGYIRGAGPGRSGAGASDPSCWDVLGVAPHATAEEIGAAWRSLAREAHPDRGGSNDRMAALNAARSTALAERRRG